MYDIIYLRMFKDEFEVTFWKAEGYVIFLNEKRTSCSMFFVTYSQKKVFDAFFSFSIFLGETTINNKSNFTKSVICYFQASIYDGQKSQLSL